MDFNDNIKNLLLAAGFTAVFSTGAIDADAQGTQRDENQPKDKGKVGNVIGSFGIGALRSAMDDLRNGRQIDLGRAAGRGGEDAGQVAKGRVDNAESRRDQKKWNKNNLEIMSEQNKWSFDEEMVRQTRDNILKASEKEGSPIPVYADLINVLIANASPAYETDQADRLTNKAMQIVRKDLFDNYKVDLNARELSQSYNLSTQYLAANSGQPFNANAPYLPGDIFYGDRDKAAKALGIFNVKTLILTPNEKGEFEVPLKDAAKTSNVSLSEMQIKAFAKEYKAIWDKVVNADNKDLYRKASGMLMAEVYEKTGHVPTPKEMNEMWKASGKENKPFNEEAGFSDLQIKAFLESCSEKGLELPKPEVFKVGAAFDLKKLDAGDIEVLRTASLDQNKKVGDFVSQATSYGKNLNNGRGGSMGGIGS